LRRDVYVLRPPEHIHEVLVAQASSSRSRARGFPTPSKRRAARALSRIDEIVYGLIDREHDAARENLASRLSRVVDEEGDQQGMSRRQLRDELLTLFSRVLLESGAVTREQGDFGASAVRHATPNRVVGRSGARQRGVDQRQLNAQAACHVVGVATGVLREHLLAEALGVGVPTGGAQRSRVCGVVEPKVRCLASGKANKRS
jgi:hypothetical protein